MIAPVTAGEPSPRNCEGVEAMMKKAISLLLAAGLALSAVPVGAQAYGPNTVWGTVPEVRKTRPRRPPGSLRQDHRDRAVDRRQVRIPQRHPRRLHRGPLHRRRSAGHQGLPPGARERLRAGGRLHVCPRGGSGRPAGGGISTTAWILMGAAAAGVTTAIVIASGEDENVASPIR